MLSQPIPAHQPGDSTLLERQDDAIQFAVVAHLASLYPVQLTLAEAIRELADGSIPGADATGVQDAIRSLTRAGLLRPHGAYIVPTRATLRLMQLWGES
ncbi:MAG: hypothetical protein JJE50_08825 [Actinomycetales bacterium]|nr:hypothetical protein [Actinomycetales bacterium]